MIARLEEKIRKVIGWLPVSSDVRLDWEEKLLRRKFDRDLSLLRKKGDRDEIKSLEYERHYQLQINFEYKEVLYTNRLIKKARRLRVPVPPQPVGMMNMMLMSQASTGRMGYTRFGYPRRVSEKSEKELGLKRNGDAKVAHTGLVFS